MELVAQAIFDGTITGSLIGIAALGLTLVWGIEKFPNVGHADLLTVGAYAAFALLLVGIPLGVAALLAIVGLPLLGLVIDRLVFRPLRTAPRIAAVIASAGLAVTLRGTIGVVFGSDFQGYGLPAVRAWHIGAIRVTYLDVIIVAGAIVTAVFLGAILYRTRLGLEMRAFADVHDLALVVGISPDRVLRGLWALTAGSAGLAGVLLGAKIGLTDYMGYNLIIPVFAASVLGTVGNPFGALMAGVVLGIVTELVALGLTPGIKGAVAFLVLTALLLFRPRGLFGRP